MSALERLVRLLPLAILLAALSGCASLAYDAPPTPLGLEQGWRTGRVLQVGPAAELGGRRSSDCRYRGEQTDHVYAVVAVVNFARLRHRVVPLAFEDDVHTGDRVYVNLRRCDQALVAVKDAGTRMQPPQ